ALRKDKNAAVLLNGAFQKHISMPPYKGSRGKIFLDIIEANEPLKEFETIDFVKIEPFTVIIFNQRNLFECRWDGNQKFCRQLQTNESHTWSSITLYDQEVVKKKRAMVLEMASEKP